MAAPKREWGSLKWTLNLELLNSHFKRAINRLAKNPTGRLAKSLRLKNYRGSMETRLIITMGALPYARIQDIGGTWPPGGAYRTVGRPSFTKPSQLGRFKFRGQDGKILYRRLLKPYTIKGFHWVAEGFNRFWDEGSYGANKPVSVGWE